MKCCTCGRQLSRERSWFRVERGARNEAGEVMDRDRDYCNRCLIESQAATR